MRCVATVGLALALLSAGCASQIGSIAGTSTASVACDTGTTATYSAGIIPQMQPVTASCVGSDGKTHSASITPGLDTKAIAADIISGMKTQGLVVRSNQ